jgi:hypothetical protein
MAYQGDVYDTPPLSIRVAMTVASAFGAVLMTWHLAADGFVIPCILTISGFILAAYLTWSVPRAGQTALVTAGYWTLLAGFALLLPMG